TQVQGAAPERMHVVPPYAGFEAETYRVADFGAYYRVVRGSLESAVAAAGDDQTYPEPNPQCELCRGGAACDARRRADAHLSLGAGISTTQRVELVGRGAATTAALAEMPVPLAWKPARGAAEAYMRVREQARVQVEARLSGAE